MWTGASHPRGWWAREAKGRDKGRALWFRGVEVARGSVRERMRPFLRQRSKTSWGSGFWFNIFDCAGLKAIRKRKSSLGPKETWSFICHGRLGGTSIPPHSPHPSRSNPLSYTASHLYLAIGPAKLLLWSDRKARPCIQEISPLPAKGGSQ